MGERKTLTTVYHVGNLDKGRSKPSFSYEGRGLSITTHPKAWRKIAEQVGGKTYKLENPGGVFYDAKLDGIRQKVIDWCLEHDWVEEQRGWKAGWFDVEYQTERFMYGTDYDTLRTQSEALLKDGYIVPATVYTLDTAGRKYWKQAFTRNPSSAGHLEIEGLMPVWYARHHEFDGVWWDEELDVSQYSAPRGVIFQHCLDAWTTETL